MRNPFSRKARSTIPDLTVGRSLSWDRKRARVADWLGSLHTRDIFNGAVLIAQQGQVYFHEHYGFANVEGTIPLGNHSSFSIASVTKQFTAMGILLLAQQGRLTLRDSLSQHIPELSDYRDITIRQLLHHTSGAPDYMELADEVWDSKRVLTIVDVISLFDEMRPPLNFLPGERIEYSNTGYAFLEEVIFRASGKQYPEFMHDAVFEPLGMHDSAAFNLTSKERTLRNRVFGLRTESGKKVLCDLNYLDGVFGDGGIFSSAEDLVRWDSALREGTLLPTEVYEEAYVSGRLNNGETTGYGYGWEIDPPDVVWHLGEWQGFTAYIRRDLRTHTLLVVLSNLAPSTTVDAISMQLARFVDDVTWGAPAV